MKQTQEIIAVHLYSAVATVVVNFLVPRVVTEFGAAFEG